MIPIKEMRRIATLLCCSVLAACVSDEMRKPIACDVGSVKLMSDFEGAGVYSCVRNGPATFALRIAPEAFPINPSPWYAFDVEAEQDTRVTIDLNYAKSAHRYKPKRQLTGGDWVNLQDDAITLSNRGRTARIQFDLEPGRTRLAAQEVFSPETRNAWTFDFAERAALEPFELVRSPRNRPIYGLKAGASDPGAPLIVLIGGQHPPEVPGVLGLRAFLEALFFDAENAKELFSRVQFLIVPELNPDGVAGGFWRLNTGLVDLNRDWGPFTQPETQVVKTEIHRLAQKGHRPILLLDFHATRQNIFYTPPDHFGLSPNNFSRDWLSAIETIYNGTMPPRSDSHNPDLPTSKVWFAETFQAPGITFEFGDETPREEIDALSSAAALALIQVVLSDLEEGY